MTSPQGPRPDLDSYSAPAADHRAMPDLSDPADPVVPRAAAPEPAPQKPYVLNTRMDPKVRQQLADLQRVSDIPQATIRQVLESLITKEWRRTVANEGGHRPQ